VFVEEAIEGGIAAAGAPRGRRIWQDGGMCEEPTICHEASGVVGVIKPAGLPTQAPPGIASVESWLRGRLPPGAYLGVPHRLDRAVSGIMLFAVTPRAARKLSRQFERRQVRKVYLALASRTSRAGAAVGRLAEAGPGGVTWTDAIEKIPDEPRARIAAEPSATAKVATTCARLLAEPTSDAGFVMLSLEPLTGRMHQLRVQAAARGMPIAGDAVYDTGAASFGPPTADPRAAAIALHAWRIAFADPDTGQPIRLQAPAPGWWPADAVRAAAATED